MSRACVHTRAGANRPGRALLSQACICAQVHSAVPLPAAAEKASGAELGWEPWSGAQSLVAAAQAAIQARPPPAPPASLLLEVPRTGAYLQGQQYSVRLADALIASLRPCSGRALHRNLLVILTEACAAAGAVSDGSRPCSLRCPGELAAFKVTRVLVPPWLLLSSHGACRAVLGGEETSQWHRICTLADGWA